MWNRALEVHSGYEEQELEDVVRALNRVHLDFDTGGLYAVARKYDRQCNQRVARITAACPSSLRFSCVERVRTASHGVGKSS